MSDLVIDVLIHAIKEYDGDIKSAVESAGGRFIERNFLEHGSWSVYYENIVELKGRYFKITDEDPATEMQEGQDDEEIELQEVDPYDEVVVKYKARQGAETISFYIDD